RLKPSARLEVPPRPPVRNACVVYVCRSIEKLCDLREKALQQGEQEKADLHEAQTSAEWCSCQVNTRNRRRPGPRARKNLSGNLVNQDFRLEFVLSVEPGSMCFATPAKHENAVESGQPGDRITKERTDLAGTHDGSRHKGSRIARQMDSSDTPNMKAKTQPTGKTSSAETRNHSTELQKRLRGRVIREDNAGYDCARRIWNGKIDRKPRLIAQCLDQGDVIACVQFAREREFRLAVKGNGHAVAGTAICQEGLVVDLSMMKGVRVNPQELTAWAASGVVLGELDHATQAFHLAVPTGTDSEVR